MNKWLSVGRALLAPVVNVRHARWSASLIVSLSIAVLTLSERATLADYKLSAEIVGGGHIGNPAQGKSVAISADGNTLAIGGWGDDRSPCCNGPKPVGATWIFVRSGGTWVQQAKLVGQTSATKQGNQGASVAISDDGNTVLVGAPTDDDDILSDNFDRPRTRGAAFVFVRNGNTWTQEGKLIGTGYVGYPNQGTSVALSADGNTALVGGPYDGQMYYGSAWAFTRTGGVWKQQQKIVPTAQYNAFFFGYAVALSADGNTAVIGSPSADGGNGGAWFFRRTQPSGVWAVNSTNGRLSPTYLPDSAKFGSSVALTRDGSAAAVGAPNTRQPGTEKYPGATYLFKRGQDGAYYHGSYVLGTEGVKDNVGFGTGQGYQVAIAGDQNNLSLFTSDYVDNGNKGAVWVFRGSAENASQVGSKIPGSSTTQYPFFGRSLAITPDATKLIVGATGEGGEDGPGKTFVFRATRATHDFDGNWRSDLLWRGISEQPTGTVAVWPSGGTGAGIATLPLTWSIVGQRDFDGDGKSDIIWRHDNGNLVMWFMNGTSIKAVADLGNVPPNWSIIGTGDLNGDGRGDLLWRDNAGNVAVWLLNGATGIGSAAFGSMAAYKMEAHADFTGDGKADILWRDSAGNMYIWVMDGTKVSDVLYVGQVGAPWNIVGTGDISGDRRADIIWRDTSGNVAVWLMNGNSVVAPAGFGLVPTEWSVVQTGDFDGDGLSDILWHNTAGDAVAWLMNGTEIKGVSTVGNVPPSVWALQGLNSN